MANNGNERLLVSLHNYSNSTNVIWRSQSVPLDGQSSSNISVSLDASSISTKQFPISACFIQLVFYAYCGTEKEDAVVIDDLQFLSKPSKFWTSTARPIAQSVGEVLSESTTEPSPEEPTTMSQTLPVEPTTESSMADETTDLPTELPETTDLPTEVPVTNEQSTAEIQTTTYPTTSTTFITTPTFSAASTPTAAPTPSPNTSTTPSPTTDYCVCPTIDPCY